MTPPWSALKGWPRSAVKWTEGWVISGVNTIWTNCIILWQMQTSHGWISSEPDVFCDTLIWWRTSKVCWHNLQIITNININITWLRAMICSSPVEISPGRNCEGIVVLFLLTNCQTNKIPTFPTTWLFFYSFECLVFCSRLFEFGLCERKTGPAGKLKQSIILALVCLRKRIFRRECDLNYTQPDKYKLRHVRWCWCTGEKSYMHNCKHGKVKAEWCY